jgi:hypothetical protein
MQRRLAGPLVVLVLAACGGEAFTSTPNDGGGADVGVLDTGVTDGSLDDGARPADAQGSDGSGAVADGGPMVDGPALPQDGSGSDDAAALCGRTCPAGFECVLDKCEDRVAVGFSAMKNPDANSNWRFGYNTSFGSSFILYPSKWNVATMGTTTIDAWSITSNNDQPSVFRNETLKPVTYDSMTLPALMVGMNPGPNSQVSVARWIAPIAGFYDISVTFTGISTPSTVASVGVSVNGTVGQQGTGGSLNQFTEGNTFTYPDPAQPVGAQKLNPLDTVDFYIFSSLTSVQMPTASVTGGASIEAKLTIE